MNDYSDLRQEAQLEILRGRRTMDIEPAVLLQLIDDLVEAEEKLGDANDERIEAEENAAGCGDLKDAINDALIWLNTPTTDDERVAKAREILEGA